jgi:two-component system LytT family response regulator
MPIRVMLAEDEPIARRRLLRFLRSEADVEVVAECADGRAALAALGAENIDLVLLDVQLPDIDGFEVVQTHGPERMPAVIFVTAFDEYAVRAFEVQALDYLLKPVSAERFHAAFRRARDYLEHKSSAQAGRRLRAVLEQVLATDPAAAGAAGLLASAPSPSTPPTINRLTVKADGRVRFIDVNSVDWFEARGNYVRLHVGTTTHMVRETISANEAALNPSQFARIHRGTIVNIDRIRELQPWFAGDYLMILKDGTQLKLTRTYRDQLQTRLHVIS